MPIPLSTPYRPPCGGWPTPILATLGPPNQHCNPADNGKPIWQNLTKLADGSAPTYSPTAPPGLHACTGGQTTIGDNCYQVQTPAATKDFLTCRKLGFKNLVAAHFWPGRLGFTDTSFDNCTGGVYTSSPNGTRYRTKTMTATETNGTYSGGIYTTLGTQITARTYTVGKLTGLVTETVKTDSGYTGSGYNGAHKAAHFDYACGTWSDPAGLGGSVAVALNGGSPTGVTVNRSTVTATNIAFDVTVLATGAFNRYVVSVTLSDPYTSADWNTDTDALFANWDLSDDAIYPFRQDGNCWLAPLLTYDEVQNLNVNQFSLPADTFSDTTAGRYGTPATGNVIGAPLPAGYDKYWDTTARIYLPDGLGGWTLEGYGEYAPDWCPRATQWMNNLEGTYGSAGAWMQCNYNPAGGLGSLFGGRYSKCIWAETIMFVKPSHNYARPCGPDDAAYLDQTTATCSGGHLVGTPRFSSVPNPCSAPSASHYEWNDTGKKGDFIWKEWQYDYRDIARGTATRATTGGLKTFTASQACITHTPCCPNVALIAPASVTYAWSNVVQYNMPTFTLDETLSAYWQGRVEQWMKDPLWQVPSSACVTPQIEDDGTSTTGTYFPPYEEARTAVPSGAPAYPAGCGVNYTGYVAARNSGGDQIPECEPPQNGQCQYARWVTWLNQETACTWDIPADMCADYTP